MTRRLLNLEAAISQRNLATLAVLCIEWSTGRTRLYLYAWVLWMWRLRFHAVGNCSSSLGQFSTCRIGRGCALRIANTCFFFSWVETPWRPGMMPKLRSKRSGIDTNMLILVLCHSIPLKLFHSTPMEMKEGGWEKDLCWWSVFSQLCHGLVGKRSLLPSTFAHASGYLLPCWDWNPSNPKWPATNLQILCPCTSEAYLHQPISVHGGAIWMLCPRRCNRRRSAWSSGVWPCSIGNWWSWGRVWKNMWL